MGGSRLELVVVELLDLVWEALLVALVELADVVAVADAVEVEDVVVEVGDVEVEVEDEDDLEAVLSKRRRVLLPDLAKPNRV